jgi:His/Glu/Gln/Arg/opine family amino acid ABC transporter permease subunit
MTAKLRILLPQLLVLAIVVGLGAYLIHNTLDNLARQGVATGFSYLDREAAFEIGEKLIPYTSADSYGRALLVGLANTLEVGILGCILATILGLIVGVARMSRNWLIRHIAALYIQAIRNVPLLLQLFVWWDLFRVSAPPPRQAAQALAPAPVVEAAPAIAQTGTASYYGKAHQGKRTADGSRFDQKALTAAHATLPFGTRIRVTLAGTDRSVVVVITDRLHSRTRILDLSKAAASQLGMIQQGIARVSLSPA